MENKKQDFDLFKEKTYTCPNCTNSVGLPKKQRTWFKLAELLLKANKQIPETTRFALPVQPTGLFDPSKPPTFTVTCMKYELDICFECGTVFARSVKLEKIPVKYEDPRQQYGGGISG